MMTFKSMSTHQEHMLRQDRLVYDLSIFGNATPANKKYEADVPGLTIFRTQGHTAEADAVESMTWTAPVDNSGGNSKFGILLNLDQDKADKVYSVKLTQLSALSTSSPPPMGSLGPYAIVASSTVTNTGASVVTGDLALSPGSSVTGFPPGTVSGTQHIADAAAAQAQIDLTAAYNNLVARPSTSDLTGQNLGGLTLTPGVYTFSTSAQLTGTLILDGQGDAGATWVFQIGSTLTTASSAVVSLINSASAANVFWQVGSSATIGSSTTFKGSIFAQASITVNTSASIQGRALARTGAVTLDTNAVTVTSSPSSVVLVLTGPNNSSGAYLTPLGNIAIEVSATGLNLSTSDIAFELEVDYRLRRGNL